MELDEPGRDLASSQPPSPNAQQRPPMEGEGAGNLQERKFEEAGRKDDEAALRTTRQS